MAFSMHSHSGQFCPGHAKDTLEQVIQTAISRGMETFALTEHMPRNSNEDLYPEEIAANQTIDGHLPLHKAYIKEAVRLRAKYQSQIHILIGFEGEWIRPSYGLLIQTLAADPAVDFFMGSIHHVHGIPIDYDRSFYEKAIERSGSEEKLWEDYYDQQYEMLRACKPKVVGHFDLIRLLSGLKGGHSDVMAWEGVWEKVLRNLREVVEMGGLLEVNSAGLRKGLGEPYPGRAICEQFMQMGGKFTLSDDSHGIEHVGTNYLKAIEYLEGLGIKEVYSFERVESRDGDEGGNGSAKELRLKCVQLASVKESFIPG